MKRLVLGNLYRHLQLIFIKEGKETEKVTPVSCTISQVSAFEKEEGRCDKEIGRTGGKERLEGKKDKNKEAWRFQKDEEMIYVLFILFMFSYYFLRFKEGKEGRRAGGTERERKEGLRKRPKGGGRGCERREVGRVRGGGIRLG